MNKRIRSRVLAASIVSTTLLGTGGLLTPQRSLRAQDRPTAVQLLDRGSRLYEQKQFGEAKKILTDIDPAQLPEDQRAKLTDLVTRTDMALAKAMGPNGQLDAAQANLDGDRLAAAAAGYQAILNDPAAPADAKNTAKIQLALVKEKQAAKAPQMKELLAQAQTLYEQGKLDEAQNALATVDAVGADLGWDNNQKPALLRQRIAERRTAIARASAPAMPGTVVAAAPDAPTTGGLLAQAAPSTPVLPPAPAPVGNPLDIVPAPAPIPAVSAPEAAPAGGSLLQEVQSANAGQRDRAITLYNEAKRHSDEALVATPPQYAQAIAYAQEAVDVITQNRTLFSDVEAGALRDAATQRLQNATALQASFDLTEKQRDEQRTADAAKSRANSLKEAKRRQVTQLVADAGRLIEVAQYKEAAGLLSQATVIDPQYSEAKLMLRLVENKMYARDYDDLVKRRGTETMRQTNDSAEHLIPYADLMIYPDNWLEITRKRLSAQSIGDSQENRRVRRRLEEPLAELGADQQGLEKVLSFLASSTSSNIIVKWKVLENAGITRNDLISINPPLHDVPLRQALKTVLGSVGGGTVNLTYTVDDGTIVVSTREDLNANNTVYNHIYDIKDLTVSAPNRRPPNLTLGTSQNSGGQTSSSGSTGGGLFGDTTQSQQNQQQTQNGGTNPARQRLVDNTILAIKAAAGASTWVDLNGPGDISQLDDGNLLLIRQTSEGHEAVTNMLKQIRETQSVQIAIESRLLLVSNNFLDDFRFGWDIGFPAGSIGGSIGAVNIGNLGTYTQAVPQPTGIPGSILNTVPNPSLSIGATIIDNWTLNLLLTATQADKRTITVTAPRVTIWSGADGFIAVTNQLNYVASFNQTAAQGGVNGSAAVGTNLNTATLNTGVTLYVQATASADRRYVVMTINPQLSTLDGIDTFTVGVVTPPTGNNTTGNNTTGNSTTATGGAFIQLPKISATEVSTKVSIPDGGTLLVGGQKLVGESEIEIGVPVLSKIPGLNRLFTNRSFVKDERTLLVLVRPTIIIHPEIESDLFGVGYDRPTGTTGAGAMSSPNGGMVQPGGL